MSTRPSTERVQPQGQQFDRRALLVASGVAAAGVIGLPLLRRAMRMTAPRFRGTPAAAMTDLSNKRFEMDYSPPDLTPRRFVAGGCC